MLEQLKKKHNYSFNCAFLCYNLNGDNMNKKRVIGLILLTIITISVIIVNLYLINNHKDIIVKKNKYLFLAASNTKVALYDVEELNKSDELVRGTKVLYISKINDEYTKIKYNKNYFAVKSENLEEKENLVVKETKMYVRTPVTLYLENGLSLIKKGEEVTITSYEGLTNGIVDKYNVIYNGLKGKVYGKYLVFDKETSLLNYDQDSSYQKHLERTNTLGGGSAGKLDFYPFEKTVIEENIMPKEARTLYINSAAIRNVDRYIEFAKNNNINSFVVDIKDNTSPAYASLVMKEYSPTNYEHALNSFELYQTNIKKLKDAGFYVIGRITLFKDSYYINDHPEHAILDSSTSKPFNHNGSHWPSAFKREVWQFNVELAKEAVREMGFNEIQFDYVRFPDRTYNLEKAGTINFSNTYGEDKAQAIQTFLMYAYDELRSVNAYISADVFGEAAHNYVTGYGQYWGAISNVVDVISPMPYPDHFGTYEYGFDVPVWTIPYKLLNLWSSNYVVKRQEEIPTPAVVRTWIQTYNTGKAPAVIYDASKIDDQIMALYDSGLTGGYMTWNSGSSLEKYESIKEAFKKERINEESNN